MATSVACKPPQGETARRVCVNDILDNPDLPSPPALVLQIVEKASHPDCDPNDVVALLNMDSGLCCQVLKTVNSGLFGLSRSVTSLKQAVAMLGVRPVRSLVLSLAIPALHGAAKDEFTVRYWQESVAGAVIVRELARHLRRKDPDDDLVAGLLRDLGMLVLHQAYQGEYVNLRRQHSAAWAVRQCALEQNAFGADHAEISAALLESWKMPEDVFMPIRWHHEPFNFENASKPQLDRAYLLSFASKVTLLGADSSSSAPHLVAYAQRHFALDKDSLLKFLASVAPAIQEFASLLKVDIGECPNYAAIMSAGCQELVRLSVESWRGSTPTPNDPPPRMGATTEYHPRPDTSPAMSSLSSNKAATVVEFDLSLLDAVPKGGAKLNSYEIESLIGRGGMGVVLKGFDPALARHIAIKMLRPEGMVRSDGRERFAREARAVAAIQHENVVAIYAISEVNGMPYLVMEYVPGMSLQDELDRDDRLPIAEISRYGRQIAAGLSAAHRRRVIHRDIKPANILIATETGTAKITDFGLARVLDQTRLSLQGTWVGTPQYMAPEQFAGEDVDHRADLFSLGSLLYTLCAGKPPFPGSTPAVLFNEITTKTPVPLRALRPDAPAWLIDLINKLMTKAPAQRFQSAVEVVTAFEQHA